MDRAARTACPRGRMNPVVSAGHSGALQLQSTRLDEQCGESDYARSGCLPSSTGRQARHGVCDRGHVRGAGTTRGHSSPALGGSGPASLRRPTHGVAWRHSLSEQLLALSWLPAAEGSGVCDAAWVEPVDRRYKRCTRWPAAPRVRAAGWSTARAVAGTPQRVRLWRRN